MSNRILEPPWRSAAMWFLLVVLAVAAVSVILDGSRPAVAAGDCQYHPYGPYGPEPCEKVTPTIVASSSPTTAEVGATLQAFAVLAQGDGPLGTVEFRLYGPADSLCSGTPAHVESAALSNGGGGTSTGFVANAVGTWRWVVHYGGDATNNAVTSACGAASTTVAEKVKAPTGKPGGEEARRSWSNCVDDRSIVVPFGSRLVIGIGYAALEKKQVRDFLSAVVTEAWVDGSAVRNADRYWGTIEWDPTNSWWVSRWLYDTGRVMEVGTPSYTIAFRQTLTKAVFDGLDTLPPGVLVEIPSCLVSGVAP